MDSVAVLLVNAIAYSAVLVYMYIWRGLSLGFLLWGLYTVSAWTSFLFIQHPMYIYSMHASTQTLYPCIYLFALLLICIMPLTRIKAIGQIQFTNPKALRIILKLCVIFQCTFILLDIETVFHLLTSNIEFGDIRAAAYGREQESFSIVTKIPFINRMHLLYMGMKPLATGLSVILFFCYKKDRSLVSLFAFTTLLHNLETVIITAGRGELVISFCIYAVSIYLVRSHLSKKAKRAILVYTIPIIAVGATFFWAITVSRFGDAASFFMYKYLGEPMNNFNGILFNSIHGNTEGQAYFSYIYRYVLGYKSHVNTEQEYQLIEKVAGVPAFIFYTYIGGLVIEFGKIIPILIVIIFNRIIVKNVKRVNMIGLNTVLVYIFFIYFYTYGLFTFPIQNFTGFMIFYLLAFHFLFRKDPDLIKSKAHRLFMRSHANQLH